MIKCNSFQLSGCGGMADAADSKSAAREGVRVRVPLSAFTITKSLDFTIKSGLFCYANDVKLFHKLREILRGLFG